jgi:hypothetical protein
MSKKWSKRYTAYKEIMETIDAQLRAARRNLVDADKELMKLCLHLFILMLDSDSSKGYASRKIPGKNRQYFRGQEGQLGTVVERM